MSQQPRNTFGGSPAKSPSILVNIFASLCPCIGGKPKGSARQGAYKIPDTVTENFSHHEEQHDSKDMALMENRVGTLERYTTLPCSIFQENDNFQDHFSTKPHSHIQARKLSFTSEDIQGKIVPIGLSHKVLFKIHTTTLQPSPASLEDTKATNEKNPRPSSFPNSLIKQCWKKRYLYFQKFDDGIRFDEESYVSTPPEALASHLASRIKFSKILNAFPGIAAYMIKLSNTCGTIIATDVTANNRDFIQNNLGVYGVENVQLLTTPFIDTQKLQVDAVILTPPWGSNYDPNKPYSLKVMDIGKLFQKALSMSSNVVLVLPSNIDLQQLASILGQTLQQSSYNSHTHSSCSFEVQQILFMGKIRHTVVYYGLFVNKEIRISDQLETIYQILGNTTFKCRRLSKFIREQYGLPFLLNLSLKAQFQIGVPFQNLVDIIQASNIVPKTKLKSFLSRSNQLKKSNSTENPNSDQLAQVTQSIRTYTHTNSMGSSLQMGGVEGSHNTIELQCSQSIKHSSKLSRERSSQITTHK